MTSETVIKELKLQRELLQQLLCKVAKVADQVEKVRLQTHLQPIDLQSQQEEEQSKPKMVGIW